MAKSRTKLGELYATAICGNDISSSVLYVSALAIIYAGQYAWITLLIVVLVLFIFRRIYGEVVGALPLNGGAYNALLNTTRKSIASLAATLTLLSYMATAVISANEAMHYLRNIFPSLEVIIATIVLLGLFAILVILGLKESARVALGIFIFHLSSMVLLSVFIIMFLMKNGLSQFWDNYRYPVIGGDITTALFFGFSASMLGISGFESSANFVEEQQRGVFPKTLRNMWIVVGILNPLMAFFALSLISIPEVRDSYADTLLSQMAAVTSGEWLRQLIAVDAVLVLSGAVLTSYVGVSGLLERMTLDRILPQYFLKRNKYQSSYRIIILFFLLGVSVLLITNGKVVSLAGVYTISFLSVMGLFAIGNILLKIKRKTLPRPEKATWIGVFVAIIAVVIALIGNFIIPPKDPDQPNNLGIFLDYFIPALIFILVMLKRTIILKLLLNLISYIFKPIQRFFIYLNKRILDTIDRINQQEFVFFTKGDSIANLNKVMLYISRNEHTSKIKIVTVLSKDVTIPDHLETDIEVLDREYPEIDIEFVKMNGTFGPALIKQLSKEWNIPVNFMFIGSPGSRFSYRIEDLGGVRLII